MSQTATASLGEREALSEIFLLFSALFDGPPPTQIVPKLLTETFPELSKAVGLTPLREAIDPADFATEYEPLFLIPGATGYSLLQITPIQPKGWAFFIRKTESGSR